MKKIMLHPLTLWLLLGLTAVASAVAVVEGVRVQHQIQGERRDSILAGCRDQNHRHDATISYLDGIARKQERKHPGQTKQIEASLGEYDLLIQALAPRQNCPVIADKYVKEGP